MKNLIVVAGARPNFMKVAPVLAELRRRGGLFRPVLVHTGQHYDEQMSGVFFEQLGIPAPDAHLGAGAGTHGAQTARILESFEKFLMEQPEKPAGVMVAGDVNSTVACALAAAKLQIRVAHLESGLRSFDRAMPEEINRIVTDSISDLLLVSEPAGEVNLRNEGIPPERIVFAGNVMIDTLVKQLENARALSARTKYGAEAGKYALVTLHRPSNVDVPERLRGLVQVFQDVARRMPVIFPVHPRTRQRLEGLALSATPGVHFTDPMPYREMLSLQSEAAVVVTDSGGMQEETSYLGVPCLTLRANTERPVTLTLGTNTLVPGDPQEVAGYLNAIAEGKYKRGQAIPGWDGHAAERVVDALAAWR